MTEPVDRPRRTIVFWSGGKDASLLVDELSRSETYEVVALLTTFDEEAGLVPFQSLEIAGVRRQADALGLPLIEVGLPERAPDDVYVDRVMRALETASDLAATHVAFGDLELEDIRQWRREMFEASGFDPIFPLWGRDTSELARSFLDREFRAMVSTVDTDALDTEMLGETFDGEFLESLPGGVDPCGENGEFHTVVWDGPIFDEALQPVLGECTTGERFASVRVGLGESADRGDT